MKPYIFRKHNYIVTFAATGLLFASYPAIATPWFDAGDFRLRHELQLLSDKGMLNTPTTTWPLSTKNIHTELKKPSVDQTLEPALQHAYEYLTKRLEQEDYGSSFKVGGDFYSKETLIRDFSGRGREKASVYYDGQWGNPIVDMRLKLSLADKSNHPSDRSFRLDESYLSSSFNDWKVTVGKQSRWWGPSWDGSLILSNNARPIPSISIENISSEASRNKFLRLFGPYKFHAFVGKLESERTVPNAKVIGARIAFKPFKSFEVGIHRITQWGGDNGDESLSGFIKSMVGTNSNTKGDLLAGNNIAGFDARWRLPIKSNHSYALYTQYLAEDRSSELLAFGDEIFLLGGSISGYSNKLGGSWRTYIEATDTSSDSYKGAKRNNTVYNHGTYKDGYRHLGLSMGHGIDSDSTLISVGTMLSKKNGDFWRGWVKHATLNKDGIGKNPIAPHGKKWSAIGFSLDKKFNSNININFGGQLISEKEIGKHRHNNVEIFAGFSYDF